MHCRSKCQETEIQGGVGALWRAKGAQTSDRERLDERPPSALQVSARGQRVRAYVTNALHEVSFGLDQLAENEAFFRQGLRVMKGSNLRGWAYCSGQ